MPFDAQGNEMPAGGSIPVAERTAYRTYSDRNGRTNVSVLVANYPVTSKIESEVFPPYNGFVTANHSVVYEVNSVAVLERRCQIILPPDRSEATVAVWEESIAGATEPLNRKSVTITREQFDLLKEVWG